MFQPSWKNHHEKTITITTTITTALMSELAPLLKIYEKANFLSPPDMQTIKDYLDGKLCAQNAASKLSRISICKIIIGVQCKSS